MDIWENESAIAVVGMAGRFPGAGNIDELWSLLQEGREALVWLSPQELRASGVPEALLSDKRYVRATMKLEDAEHFDAAFFGYTPRQAVEIDPQHRLFLECAWEALEHSGYCPEGFKGSIGVFAGSGASSYLLKNALRIGKEKGVDLYQALLDCEKDYLTTRTSYKLGLTGPSIAVQTACSSSLVAVHLASQSLLNFECDLALAGGVFVKLPQEAGYLHVEGGISSRDGHCRAFDVDATGMVAGSGVAIVVLRRLADAARDSDDVHAVLCGSAVNNDGSRKAGFAAPAQQAQTEVVASALATAGLAPSHIGMVEAHGTGTVLGDAIELAALNAVFKRDGKGQCALGSIKTNIGHLDAAAGATGLIKAILCLKNGCFVPSLNFEKPNPLLEGPSNPFFVNTELRRWPAAPGVPRRAGVSSFGIGGTNAHVVVEEAPPRLTAADDGKDHLFPLSAVTATALQSMRRNLREYLQAHAQTPIADVAFTLQTGRRRFGCREFAVAADIASLIAALEEGDSSARPSSPANVADRPVVFMFPGQGGNLAGCAAALYDTEETFRNELDRCTQPVLARTGVDIKRVLCAGPDEARHQPSMATLVQPSLFVLEYCLARLWMSWGIQPAAVIGHSLGEYVAACIAGVCSFEECLSLVMQRARIVSLVPRGSMVAVSLGEKEVSARLTPGLSVAAVNTASQCVVSGRSELVDELRTVLRREGIECVDLSVTHAFHSEMVDPAVQALIEAASRTKWTRPRIPFFSCTTGELVEEPGVVDARYWGAHLRNVVRFADGVSELLRKWGPIFLEVGPGRALTGFAGAQRASQADVSAVASLPKGSCNDRKALLRVLGTLWSHGASVDWHQFHDAEPRRKVALPTYPFERQPFRMAANGSQSRRGGSESRDESQPPARWFYTPSWKIQQPLCPAEGRPANRRWLVFVNESDFGRSLLSSLRAVCGNVVAVFPGEKYVRTAFDSFRIRPGRDEDYGRLLTECAPSGDRISDVLHCWSALHPGGRGPQAAAFEEAQEWGYFSVLSLVQAMCGSETRSEWSMLVVTRGLQCVLQGDGGFAAQAPVSALCKVVAQEFAGAQCCALDIPECMNPDSDGIELRQCVVAIVSESMADRYEPEVALRAGRRFVRTHEPLQLASGNRPARSLRTHGTYVITGGLGRVGLAIAERLAREVRANLVLIGRSRFPPREKWKQIAGQTARTDAEASKVRRLLEMESVGASVLVLSADVSEGAELTCAFAEAEARFGPAHGVFHLAAETQHPSGVRLLRRMDRPAVEVQTRPKVLGFCTLAGVLQERCPDFVVSFSSNASILGGMGFGAYAAANAFLDHIAFSMESNGPCFWMTTNWDEWTSSSGSESGSALPNPFAISMEEGVDALLSVVSAATVPQVIVSRRSLDVRVNRWLRQRTAVERVAEKSVGDEVKPAAREGTRVRPRNALERTIAEVWEELLGISDVGVEDDFMGLGGDSLVALRVVSRLYEAFGVSIPIRTLVEAPATITRVAVEVVSKLSSLQDAALVEEHLEQAEAAQREKYAECR